MRRIEQHGNHHILFGHKFKVSPKAALATGMPDTLQTVYCCCYKPAITHRRFFVAIPFAEFFYLHTIPNNFTAQESRLMQSKVIFMQVSNRAPDTSVTGRTKSWLFAIIKFFKTVPVFFISMRHATFGMGAIG